MAFTASSAAARVATACRVPDSRANVEAELRVGPHFIER
jgi:hypothetical protein